MTVSHLIPQPYEHEPHQYAQHPAASTAVQPTVRPLLSTTTNGEEASHNGCWPFQFTKGMPHDERGFVAPDAYKLFLDAVKAPSLFSTTALLHVPVGQREMHGSSSDYFAHNDTAPQNRFHCTGPEGTPLAVCDWEAQRSGHMADQHVTDADDLPLPPAPSVGTDELTAEMAEIYSFALLRDVPFTAIRNSDETPGAAGATPKIVQDALKQLSWFRSDDPVTGIFAADGEPLSEAEKARRAARLQGRSALDGMSILRGSASGTMVGPYVSQFILAGSTDAPEDGLIRYGVQTISQKIARFEAGLDYMTDWHSWLDVQNGADVRDLQEWGDFAESPDFIEAKRLPPRFITTPRDLASLVRDNALQQAYLNAALMLQPKVGFDLGLSSSKAENQHENFATFGDPRLLPLMNEVTSRSLKSVRRQKFNHHRRARPERLGAMLTLVANNDLDGLPARARQDLIRMYGELHQTGLLNHICAHNALQLKHGGNPLENRDNIGDHSMLLPMAYIEGAPMDPAYGAGHAAVAGACVTLLKAFFQLFKSDSCWDPLTLADIGTRTVFEPTEDGSALRDSIDDPADITVEGELNKLAANISLGRNMAGVHYYSDYHDSLRLGERLAVSILEEKMCASPKPWNMRLHGFDGEKITIRSRSKTEGLRPQVEIEGQSYLDWLSIGTHRVSYESG